MPEPTKKNRFLIVLLVLIVLGAALTAVGFLIFKDKKPMLAQVDKTVLDFKKASDSDRREYAKWYLKQRNFKESPRAISEFTLLLVMNVAVSDSDDELLQAVADSVFDDATRNK